MAPHDLTERAAAKDKDIVEWAEIVQHAYKSGNRDAVQMCLDIIRKRVERPRDVYEIRSIYKIRCDEAKCILAQLLARLASEGG